MTGSPNDFGTHTWVERTGGLLTAAERRSLIRPLASAQVINVVGRLSVLVGVNTGRRALVPAGRLRPPDSVLTRAAEAEARRRLTPALLNHSYRTFAFGSALGAPWKTWTWTVRCSSRLRCCTMSGCRPRWRASTSPGRAPESLGTWPKTSGSRQLPRTRCGPPSPCTTARA